MLTLPNTLARRPFTAISPMALRLMLGCLVLSAQAQGATIRVGSGGSCDESSPYTAILNASPGDSLEIAEGQYTLTNQLVLAAKDLEIRGGYSNTCNGVVVQSGSVPTTRLIAAAGKRHFSVAGGSLLLERIDLTGGNVSQGGAIFASGSNAHLLIVDSQLAANTANSGGAVALLNQATLESVGSVFSNNFSNTPAGGGGAILCTTANLELYDTQLYANTAAGSGGAIWGSDCNVLLLASPPDSNPKTRLYANEAQSGGAIDLEHGDLTIGYDEAGLFPHLVELRDNSATGKGGAIHLRGNADLFLGRVDMSLNTAGDGGAIAMSDWSELRSMECSSSKACLNAVSNSADNDGGFLYIGSSGYPTVYLDRFSADSNWAETRGSFAALEILPAGRARDTRASDRGLSLANGEVVFTPANKPSPISVLGAFDFVRLHNTTFSRNLTTDPVIDIEEPAALDVRRSIFWHNEGIILDAHGRHDEATFVCNALEETASLPSGHSGTLTADPLLLGAGVGDFRLPAHSPAVDLCAPPEHYPFVDIAGRPRLMGLAIDAGAWEKPDLFEDSFETGATNQWDSSTGP